MEEEEKRLLDDAVAVDDIEKRVLAEAEARMRAEEARETERKVAAARARLADIERALRPAPPKSSPGGASSEAELLDGSRSSAVTKVMQGADRHKLKQERARLVASIRQLGQASAREAGRDDANRALDVTQSLLPLSGRVGDGSAEAGESKESRRDYLIRTGRITPFDDVPSSRPAGGKRKLSSAVNDDADDLLLLGKKNGGGSLGRRSTSTASSGNAGRRGAADGAAAAASGGGPSAARYVRGSEKNRQQLERMRARRLSIQQVSAEEANQLAWHEPVYKNVFTSRQVVPQSRRPPPAGSRRRRRFEQVMGDGEASDEDDDGFGAGPARPAGQQSSLSVRQALTEYAADDGDDFAWYHRARTWVADDDERLKLARVKERRRAARAAARNAVADGSDRDHDGNDGDDGQEASSSSSSSLSETLSSSSSSSSSSPSVVTGVGAGRRRRLADDGDDEVGVAGLEEPVGGFVRAARRLSAIIAQRLCAGGGDRVDEEDEEKKGHQHPPCRCVVIRGALKTPLWIHERLFEYQRTGVRWLWELHQQGAGGIIGDEMGLGKTVTIAAFLASLHASRLLRQPVLVVCPASVMEQWVRELHKWWPPFRVLLFHESGTHAGSRRALLDQKAAQASAVLPAADGDDGELDGEGEEGRRRQRRAADAGAGGWVPGAVVVTTYDAVRRRRGQLQRRAWSYVVLDEGHKIRNPDAAVTLACKQFDTAHRLVLTGAPIQNSLVELWSLFDFVFPGRLGTLPVFRSEFELPIRLGGYANASQFRVRTAYKCAVALRELIRPYLLRRLKRDVLDQMPGKTEHVLFCRLTDVQRRAYNSFLDSDLAQSMLMDGRINLLYGIDVLRKICNHPDLVRDNSSVDLAGAQLAAAAGTEAAAAVNADTGRLLGGYGHWERAGKLVVLSQLLAAWKRADCKALVFAQTRQMLDIVERFAREAGYVYRRMDGLTPIGKRLRLVDEFNEQPDVFCFLLTTRVGGLGLNLIGANRVVIMDPDWNPSTDMQARERAWRIGQRRDVAIYRLMTSGTIEEKIYHRQIFKQFLTNKILRDPKQRRFLKMQRANDLFAPLPPPVPKTSSSSANSTTASGGSTTAAAAAAVAAAAAAAATDADATSRNVRSTLASSSSSTSHRGVRRHVSETGRLFRDLQSEILPADVAGVDAVEEARLGGEQLQQQQQENKDDDDDDSSNGLEKHDDGVYVDSRRRMAGKRKAPADGDGDAGAAPAPASDDMKLLLRSLFDGNSLESALRHDAIEAGAGEQELVAREADAIAEDAVEKLRESRRLCANAPIGQPTWTGRAGFAGAPVAVQRGARVVAAGRGRRGGRVGGPRGRGERGTGRAGRGGGRPMTAAASRRPVDDSDDEELSSSSSSSLSSSSSSCASAETYAVSSSSSSAAAADSASSDVEIVERSPEVAARPPVARLTNLFERAGGRLVLRNPGHFGGGGGFFDEQRGNGDGAAGHHGQFRHTPLARPISSATILARLALLERGLNAGGAGDGGAGEPAAARGGAGLLAPMGGAEALVEKLVQFLASRRDRAAPTAELVRRSKVSLESADDAAVFRALLKKIARFSRSTGRWTLLPEFDDGSRSGKKRRSPTSSAASPRKKAKPSGSAAAPNSADLQCPLCFQSFRTSRALINHASACDI